MKIGERLPVDIQGVNVAEAVVEDIEGENAVIIIPATRLVVKIRQELDLAATDEPEVDRIFAGTVEPAGDNDSPASQEISAPSSEGIHGRELDSSAID